MPPPTITRSLAALLALAPLTACEGGRSGGDPGEAIVLGASDVRLLGTSDSLAIVRDLDVLPDGTVWVLNSVPPFFVGFDAQGEVLRVHGARGGGPEEFQGPAGLVAGGVGGAAWTFDRRRNALIRVSGPEAARTRVPLPRETLPPGSVAGGMNLLSDQVRTASLGEEVILPRRSNPPEEGVFSYWLSLWTADLVAFDPETGSVRDLVALAEVLGDPTPYYEQLSGGRPPFPLWYRLWAVCGDRIRVYDRIRNEVRAFAADGTELEATALPPPVSEVSHEQFARAIFDVVAVERMGAVPSGDIALSPADSAQILREILSRREGTPEQLATLLPRYVDYRCADDGTQWIQPLDLGGIGLRGGPLWLRIGPGGEAREVRLPDRFDPYRFTTDRIWGVQRDSLDIASVGWIEAP